MRTITLTALAATTLVNACAAYPGSVAPAYVSPNQYANYSCEQLVDERARVTAEVNRVSDVQRSNANGDTAFVVGSLFLWPVAFGLAATHDHAPELAQDKGMQQAVQSEIVAKRCQP